MWLICKPGYLHLWCIHLKSPGLSSGAPESHLNEPILLRRPARVLCGGSHFRVKKRLWSLVSLVFRQAGERLLSIFQSIDDYRKNSIAFCLLPIRSAREVNALLAENVRKGGCLDIKSDIAALRRVSCRNAGTHNTGASFSWTTSRSRMTPWMVSLWVCRLSFVQSCHINPLLTQQNMHPCSLKKKKKLRFTVLKTYSNHTHLCNYYYQTWCAQQCSALKTRRSGNIECKFVNILKNVIFSFLNAYKFLEAATMDSSQDGW